MNKLVPCAYVKRVALEKCGDYDYDSETVKGTKSTHMKRLNASSVHYVTSKHDAQSFASALVTYMYRQTNKYAYVYVHQCIYTGT